MVMARLPLVFLAGVPEMVAWPVAGSYSWAVPSTEIAARILPRAFPTACRIVSKQLFRYYI